MIAVALKGLAGRKVRALLTALAVVIGVSMVSGTYILTDTMQKSFDGLFTATYDKTDAVIIGKEIVKDSTSGTAPRSPPSLLDQGPGAARGRRGRRRRSRPDEANAADIIGRDGKKVARESVGGSIDADHARVQPAASSSPASGRRARTQVVIDAGTAAKQHYKVGDTIVVSTLGAKHTYTLAGIVSLRRASTRSASPASPPGTSRPPRRCCTARAASTRSRSRPRRASRRPQLVRAVQPLRARRRCRSRTATQAGGGRRRRAQREHVDPSRYFLLGFGAHRAARRRVRDLQHAVDHGRPAHA